tara:strand:- start:5 stop:175 length:171 start_codon:yes stop_codon:yes gene_type:complete
MPDFSLDPALPMLVLLSAGCGFDAKKHARFNQFRDSSEPQTQGPHSAYLFRVDLLP